MARPGQHDAFFRIPKGMWAAFAKEAAKDGRTANRQLVHLIRQYLAGCGYSFSDDDVNRPIGRPKKGTP
jgi:hypothetical protein